MIFNIGSCCRCDRVNILLDYEYLCIHCRKKDASLAENEVINHPQTFLSSIGERLNETINNRGQTLA